MPQLAGEEQSQLVQLLADHLIDFGQLDSALARGGFGKHSDYAGQDDPLPRTIARIVDQHSARYTILPLLDAILLDPYGLNGKCPPLVDTLSAHRDEWLQREHSLYYRITHDVAPSRLATPVAVVTVLLLAAVLLTISLSYPPDTSNKSDQSDAQLPAPPPVVVKIDFPQPKQGEPRPPSFAVNISNSGSDDINITSIAWTVLDMWPFALPFPVNEAEYIGEAPGTPVAPKLMPASYQSATFNVDHDSRGKRADIVYHELIDSKTERVVPIDINVCDWELSQYNGTIVFLAQLELHYEDASGDSHKILLQDPFLVLAGNDPEQWCSLSADLTGRLSVQDSDSKSAFASAFDSYASKIEAVKNRMRKNPTGPSVDRFVNIIDPISSQRLDLPASPGPNEAFRLLSRALFVEAPRHLISNSDLPTLIKLLKEQESIQIPSDIEHLIAQEYSDRPDGILNRYKTWVDREWKRRYGDWQDFWETLPSPYARSYSDQVQLFKFDMENAAATAGGESSPAEISMKILASHACRMACKTIGSIKSDSYDELAPNSRRIFELSVFDQIGSTILNSEALSFVADECIRRNPKIFGPSPNVSADFAALRELRRIWLRDALSRLSSGEEAVMMRAPEAICLKAPFLSSRHEIVVLQSRRDFYAAQLQLLDIAEMHRLTGTESEMINMRLMAAAKAVAQEYRSAMEAAFPVRKRNLPEPLGPTTQLDGPVKDPDPQTTAASPAIAPFDKKTATQYQEDWAKYLKVPIQFTNSVGITFRLIPPGDFQMGSERPPRPDKKMETFHSVRLSEPFYMSVYEVTQDSYSAITRRNPSMFQGVERPVDSIDFGDAVEFCKLLTDLSPEMEEHRRYRLPSEAEWEFSCRAGTTTEFHFGNTLSTEQANVSAPFGGAIPAAVAEGTTKVGSYVPNPFGLYDMHGNVAEWTSDRIGPMTDFEKPEIDPQGPADGLQRIMRGACHTDSGELARSASRGWQVPISGRVGIRLVCEIPSKRPRMRRISSAGDHYRHNWATALRVPIQKANPFGMHFEFIPPGIFEMGSPEGEGGKLRSTGEGVHVVTLSRGYYFGETEVSQDHFKLVMGLAPSYYSGGHLPVESVTWDEAVEFCQRLSLLDESLPAGMKYRLPTEAEWEYACRAGTTTAFNTGDKLSSRAAQFSTHETGSIEERGPPKAVANLFPNEFGLCFMHGNVAEWCSDWYSNGDTIGSVENPRGPVAGTAKVTRGGSFATLAERCRSAHRAPCDKESTRKADLGFRILLTIEAEEPFVSPR